MTARLLAALAILTLAAVDCDPRDARAIPATGVLDEAATAYAPAVRIYPPPPQPALTGCEEMSAYRQAAGLPNAFDAIGWRESNCRNSDEVRTSCCVSYWQLWVELHLRDSRIAPGYHDCGVWSEGDVNSDTAADKWRAACATKALYDVMGMSPWKATA